MNIKILSEKKVKMILNKNELHNLNVTISDFEKNNPKMKKAVSTLIDMMKCEYGFFMRRESNVVVEISYISDEKFMFLFNCDQDVFIAKDENSCPAKIIKDEKCLILISKNIDNIICAARAVEVLLNSKNETPANDINKICKVHSRLIKTNKFYNLAVIGISRTESGVQKVFSEFGRTKLLNKNCLAFFGESCQNIICDEAIEKLSKLK